MVVALVTPGRVVTGTEVTLSVWLVTVVKTESKHVANIHKLSLALSKNIDFVNNHSLDSNDLDS